MTDKTEPLDLEAFEALAEKELVSTYSREAITLIKHNIPALIAEVRRLRGMFEFEADEALRTFRGCAILPVSKFEEYERAKIENKRLSAPLSGEGLAELEARHDRLQKCPSADPLHKISHGERAIALCGELISALRSARAEVEAAVKAEREACAKIVDTWLDQFSACHIAVVGAQTWANDAMLDIAEAIRQRSNGEG